MHRKNNNISVGQVLNLHPNVMYLYEPCRALKHRGVPEEFNTWGSIDKCTKLSRAVKYIVVNINVTHTRTHNSFEEFHVFFFFLHYSIMVCFQ
jgi:hypothetical protein